MRPLLAGVTALIMACGGDSTAPEPPFPAVAGVYDVTGRFNHLPASTTYFSGTLSLSQASRDAGTLTGSTELVLRIEQSVVTIFQGLSAAQVSETGVLWFVVPGAGGIVTWTFTGTKGSSGISSGQHTLSDGTNNFSGTWEASPASSAARAPGVASR